MKIELTDDQRQTLDREAPLRLLDGATHAAYVLLRADVYERLRAAAPPPVAQPLPEVPPGIRRSKEALRRDLPQLLQNKKLLGKCACYSGDERIGISSNMDDLIRECLRRGLPDDQYYIGVIEPLSLIEEEEIEI